MMGDDALNRTKSRAGSLYIPAGVGIDQRRPSINQPITSPEKPTRRYVPNIGKNVNRYQPSGDLVRCVETESLTSVTHLATIPGSNIVYWGNESGEIGYLDTGKLTRRLQRIGDQSRERRDHEYASVR